MSGTIETTLVEVDSIGWRGTAYEPGDIIEYTHFAWNIADNTKVWTRHQGRIEQLHVRHEPGADVLLVRATVYTSGGRLEEVWFHRAGQLHTTDHVRNCGKLGDQPEGALF